MNFDDLKKDIEKKKAPLVKVELKETDNHIIANKIDFSKYKFNNWLLKSDNDEMLGAKPKL